MSNFPTTVTLRHPLTRGVRVNSRVVQFLDDSEQRWREGPVLNSFTLQFNGIKSTEVALIRNWFLTVKGAFDSTWSLTVGAETFTNMALETDDLIVTEDAATRYSLSLAMRQTAPSGTWPAQTAVWPGISGSVITQRPWTVKDRFLTTRNDLPGGKRYSFYERGTPLKAWDVTFPVITVAEMVALMEFFVGMGGRHGAFEFTDPDTATAYPNCRFDTDAFSGTYVDAGKCSVSLPVVEFA